MTKIITLFVFIFFGHLVLAQNDTLFKSKVSELLKLKPLVMATKIYSATKTEQEIGQAPNLVAVFSRKQIQQYGLLSFNDVLFRQVGTSVSQDFDRTTVSMRGTFESWNSNHWLMLIDGVPFNGNTYGSAFTSEVTPLLFTQSVEILRGAGSALYGGGAMHGVIGINTVEVEDMKGNSEGRARIGNSGAQIYDAMVGVENSHLSIILAFNHYQNAGNNYFSYDASGRTNPDGTLQKFKTNHALSSNYFFSKIQFKGKLSGLSLQYHEQAWNFGTGVGWTINMPDQAENMTDFRRIFAISYKKDLNKNISLETVARYQRHGWSWNMRLAPDSVYFGNTLYPFGISEYVKTHVDDVFTRLQINWSLNNYGKLLLGTENTFYYYGGDEGHQANIDLNNTFAPNPNNQLTAINGYFAYAQNRLVLSKGFFAQYISPQWFSKLRLTAGVRFDDQTFDYTDIWDNGQVKSKFYRKFTPRLSLVYTLKPNFYLKAIAGRAFRLPSYAEVFSANSFAVASNINELQPETVTTYEMAFDWKIKQIATWRANVFYTDFANIVAYSGSNNVLATNVYSQCTGGFETELEWNKGKFSGFLNYHYTRLFSEEVLDKTVSTEDNLTWIPAQTAKSGIIFQAKKWYSSLSLIYQGEVKRRSSDKKTTILYSGKSVETQKYRPENVPAWFSANYRIAYNPIPNIEIGLQINHLLNDTRYLLKYLSFPFDYQMPQRLILFEAKFNY